MTTTGIAVNKGVKEMQLKSIKPKEIVKWFGEINNLKRIGRTGWWRTLGPQAERDTVAAHIAVMTQITYLLARMEGLDSSKCVMLAVFHDNAETRIGEMDKVVKEYIESSEPFLEAMKDQVAFLPEEIGQEIFEFTREVNSGETPEAKLVKDADTIESAVQAIVFGEGGFAIPPYLLAKYLDETRVQTKSAKVLMLALQKAENLSTRWWFEKLRI